MGLTATPGAAQATLTWWDRSDSTITGYSYRYATNPSAFTGASPPPWSAIPSSTATTTSHAVTGLANGTRYYFRLRATNADGNGPAAQTTIQLATTPAAAVTISDAALRTALENALDKSAGASITQLDMAKVKSLTAASSGISDLTGIEHTINVTSLTLPGNSISDVSALGTLTTLAYLYLSENSISNVSALATLTSLRRLDLSKNAISDVSTLGTLTSLRGLDLSGNSISNVSALGTLTSLQGLDLSGNAVSDVSALGTLGLIYLYVSRNLISDISHLRTLTNVSAIRLDNNAISDVSDLSNLERLSYVDLHGNSIRDVSGLGDLERLTYVDLHGNAISTVGALAEGMAFSVASTYWELDDLYSVPGRLGFFDLYDYNRNPVIYLTANPLSAGTISSEIPALEGKGVRVFFDRGAPPAPAGLTASVLEDGRVALRWTSASGTSYEVRYGRNEAGLGDWTAIAGSDAAAGRYMVEGLASGFTYIFHLRAVSGEAGPPARAEATLPAAPAAMVQIANPGLAVAVAGALGKGDGGTFTRGELATITTLDLSRADSAAPALGGRALAPSAQDIAGAPITGLAGIELLVNLRRLNLDGNAVRDLAPLLKLRHLEWLSVRGQALTSDSVYVHIPALRARGVEVLFDAPVLASFADAGLRGSVERALGKSGGATITQGDLLGLRTLHAAGAGVEDLAGIEMAVHLDWLDLSGNRLEDVGALASLPSLGWLDLSDNGLADVSALSGLVSLRTLLLGGNALADVSPLSNLTRLRSLVLSDNELEDVSPLSSLVGLEQLWLAGNRLADVAPLAGLTSLRYLHLGGNRVADVSPLRGLRALKRLWLNDNALANLAPVLGLRSLVWLDAAGNRVADVRLNGAPLQRLRLDDNLIENVDGLVNSRLGEGDVVGLRGNPLSAASVETHVPALRKRGVAVLAGRPVPLFPSAADASGRVGFVRVLNRSDRTGNVLISAVDDAGERFGPVRLTIAAGAAAHLNSKDLEAGNAAKGLHAGVGARSVAGDWRLELLSTLDIAVLAYVRTPDGFLTAMHGMLPRANGGESLRASFFNPGRNRAQRSVLRLLNPGGVEEPVSVWGADDSGAGRLATGLTVPAGGALTVDAAKLERPRAGESWRGLGRGEGKWRLRVSARWPVEAANLLESPSGHLANLSAVPRADANGTWRVPLFPAAGDTVGRRGFLRIANHDGPGEVRVWAMDDSGHRVGPAVLALDSYATVHLNSDDLERGNAKKGLPVGVGAPTGGDWRLAIASDLDIKVAPYIRHADGFVISMHELAPWNEADSAARVVFFNPASNRNQRSLLRLMNDGTDAANVVIAGVDDKAELGSEVGVTVPAGEAMTISANELENGGERLEGALGDGAGKWRLTVTADHPVGVMSLMESPTGHLSNLSNAGDGG